MPSIRRRSRVRREDFAELTNDQRRHLKSGHPFFGKGYPDRESFAIGWELHGDEIMADFIAKLPGRRPFGWWLCEHKKERPVLIPDREAEVRKQQSEFNPNKFGFLDTSQWWCPGWFQEPEELYLERNGLLTAAEIEQLKGSSQ